MLSVVLVAHVLLANLLSSAWLLAVLVLLGGLTYLLVTWIFNRSQMLEVLKMARAGL
jgi:hypothetical protein